MDSDEATGSAEVFGYLARPRREAAAGAAPGPAVAVLHGADGLTAYHREVTRRLARDGYVALAADLLSRVGGTDAVAPNSRGAALARASGAGHLAADCAGAVAHLGRLPGVDRRRIGVVGFGLGGGVAWDAALEDTTPVAVAYGGLPLLPDEGHTGRGALLALFGALDPRSDTAAGRVRRLVARGVSARLIVYPAAGRDFFDEARPRAGRGGFAPAAAAAAWQDTLEWLAFFLGAPNQDTANQPSRLPPAGAPHRRGRAGGSQPN